MQKWEIWGRELKLRSLLVCPSVWEVLSEKMASKPRPKWEEVAGPVEERLFRWSRQRVQRPWGGNSKGARTGEQGARVPGRSPSSLQRTALWPACHTRGEPQREPSSARGGQRLHWRWQPVGLSGQQSPATLTLGVALPHTSRLTFTSPCCSFPVSGTAGWAQLQWFSKQVCFMR